MPSPIKLAYLDTDQPNLPDMKTYITLFFVAMLFFACKKELTAKKCIENCETYNIKGKLNDAVTNSGLANTTVELKWSYFRYCIICPRDVKVFAGRTDANGNFAFTVSVDTTFFNNYSLELSSPNNNNYFELFPKSLKQIDLQNDSFVQVNYYPIANLKLTLRKTSTDSVQGIVVAHLWRVPGVTEYISIQDYFGTTPKIPRDTTLSIQTIAGISTKVLVNMVYANGNRAEVSDSIVCARNVISTLNINY